MSVWNNRWCSICLFHKTRLQICSEGTSRVCGRSLTLASRCFLFSCILVMFQGTCSSVFVFLKSFRCHNFSSIKLLQNLSTNISNVTVTNRKVSSLSWIVRAYYVLKMLFQIDHSMPSLQTNCLLWQTYIQMTITHKYILC